MEKLEELLHYIQKTNPTMTKEKLLEELGKCSYSAKALIYTFKNVNCGIFD